MTDDTSRRQFLRVSATVAAAGMAGCNSDGDGEVNDDETVNDGDPTDGSGTGTVDQADTREGGDGDTATDSTGDDGGETESVTDDDGSGGTNDGSQPDLRQLSVGETAEGYIDEDDPSDPQFDALGEPVEFSAQSGDTVQISMRSEAFDAYLLLLGPEDEWVAEDDDSGEEMNSQLTVDLSADGTYTAWALSFRGDSVGPYSLSISAA